MCNFLTKCVTVIFLTREFLSLLEKCTTYSTSEALKQNWTFLIHNAIKITIMYLESS